MFVKYGLLVDDNIDKKVYEIGEFGSITYNCSYNSLCVYLKDVDDIDMLAIFLPMDFKSANAFTEEFAQKIKNNETLIEIVGTVFVLDTYDKDSVYYLTPDAFEKKIKFFKDNFYLAEQLKYSIK